MPKRSNEDKIRRYKRKLRKLEEKCNKSYKRIIMSEDSEQSDKNEIDEPEAVSLQPAPLDQNIQDAIEGTDQNLTTGLEPATLQLDPDILTALGESTEEAPKFGPKIHDKLSCLWLPILKKGLNKDQKEKLFKEYLIPENCALLQPPKLNPEILAAVSEGTRIRDKKVEAVQKQLGQGIVALNKGLELLLDEGSDRISAIKFLSDSCRIFCDLHFLETDSRKKIITPGLDRNFLSLMQDVEHDELLFGNQLPEKIKASKTIEKQGLQIKKPPPNPKATPSQSTSTSYVYQPSTNRSRQPGNWAGPSRFPSTRGGEERAEDERDSSEPPITSFRSCSPETCSEQTAACNGAAIEIQSPALSQPFPGGRDALREAFTRLNTPAIALDLMLASVSNNTMKQYSVTYKLWWSFCAENSVNTFEASISSVIKFLVDNFNKGASYSTLNNHRSALSLLLGNNVGSDERIKRLLKGIYRQKPSLPKYSSTWDPKIVLDYVSSWFPHSDLSLVQINKKLTTLLAICTSHRVQTLASIKISNIRTTDSGIRILITDIIKTSGANRDQPILFLPYFTSNPRICPARTLEDYLRTTSNLRTDETADNLLLSYKKPHKRVTSQTIIRWIKQTLAESGVDVGVFSAHSTRHASTSAAASAGVCVDTIRRTAGWTSSSAVFARFYNRPVLDEGAYARSVCGVTDNTN